MLIAINNLLKKKGKHFYLTTVTAKLVACTLAVDFLVLSPADLVPTYTDACEPEHADFKRACSRLYAGYKQRQHGLEPTTSRSAVRYLNHSATTLYCVQLKSLLFSSSTVDNQSKLHDIISVS